MLMTIGGTRRFAVTLEDNPTARAQDVSVDYSYTRIGRVTEVDGLMEALGTGCSRIGFTVD